MNPVRTILLVPLVCVAVAGCSKSTNPSVAPSSAAQSENKEVDRLVVRWASFQDDAAMCRWYADLVDGDNATRDPRLQANTAPLIDRADLAESRVKSAAEELKKQGVNPQTALQAYLKANPKWDTARKEKLTRFEQGKRGNDEDVAYSRGMDLLKFNTRWRDSVDGNDP